MAKFITNSALQMINKNYNSNIKQEAMGRANHLLFLRYTLSDTYSDGIVNTGSNDFCMLRDTLSGSQNSGDRKDGCC
jgi:hypothetical protein